MQREASQVIDGLVDERELVFKFFGVFSRFECALKRASFLKTQEKAEVDWDKYANSIPGRFATVSEQGFKRACDFLEKEPPRTQVVTDGRLDWRDTPQGAGEIEERYLLRLVSTVRNNLFHGGKWPYPCGPVADVARNRQLLEAGLVVLEQCLLLSPAVGEAFEEAA